MLRNRRDFIKKSTAGLLVSGASFMFPMELLATMRKRVGPNDTVNVGLIGCNGMGFSDLSSFLKMSDINVIALCDVDENVLKARTADLEKAGIKKPKWYRDYRRLLENKDVDVAIIGTPDHWHCLQLTDALQAGKDVYCEKPIANSVQEANIMLDYVGSSDRMVQIGQWQRSQPHFVDAINFVHSGKLGEIRLAKAWAYQGWMKPVPIVPDSAAPEGVDYDMWLGPALQRPFNPNRFHFNFRWFWDYAGGLMTDWGVHLIDYALYGMKAGTPKSVMALGGKFAYPNDASETPDTLQTVYEYDGFSILWEHATGIDGGNYGRNHGIAFIGNNGTLVLDRQGWEVIPEEEFQGWGKEGIPKMEPMSFDNGGQSGLDLHTKNFMDAVKSRDASKLTAPIKVGYDAALVSHMGNVAFKTGNRIYWDETAGKFKNEEANQYLKAKYQNGWKLPMV
ncbi:Gfo/Idh/MocA family oxidoreductase [Maribacter sp. PR1]|uniref:Gfo/Idh/MocA family oxidoreductase n=1 Tax=Maribacter cobaltidurans TaxID=1178778 RepID=A0ABU7IXW8_9FLAO|nr:MULTISPECIES: Gfo/Idh/MocA family oxidoreductase [Maribacter]MDC6390339.1 Gfo/Idh/MocA family oxidoreductase [Maribacter sp. PR1]MEE1977729.1 Gfo/Idh/MocA family oxidoreductase [Maribacter cobaltidurans]